MIKLLLIELQERKMGQARLNLGLKNVEESNKKLNEALRRQARRAEWLDKAKHPPALSTLDSASNPFLPQARMPSTDAPATCPATYNSTIIQGYHKTYQARTIHYHAAVGLFELHVPFKHKKRHVI